MAPVDVVSLSRTLIDIDSTTGREFEVAQWLSAWLRTRGYVVTEQPVDGNRFNISATLGKPHVVLSTHMDCVPPFFTSREAHGVLYGRGACDAKGILAAQLLAAETFRKIGEHRVGLLFVVGEERGSDGARVANLMKQDSRYIINGEPTDNKLGIATRGLFRVTLKATGRTAHSSHPELGESAIEKLVDALVVLRTVNLPTDELLGQTYYSVGLISGGIAPNVIPDRAEAEVAFRSVGPARDIHSCLSTLNGTVDVEQILEIPPVTLTTLPEFKTAIFPFTTDIPFLSSWGKPLLLGPGSILVAHSDEEQVQTDDLYKAIENYIRLVQTLLLST